MLRNTLQHQHFARLFYATLCSQVGTQIHRVALLVLVYSLTQDAWTVSLVLSAQLIASVGLSPFLSTWSDTQERRRLLVLSDFARAPVVLLIPYLATHTLGLLLILIALVEILRTLHDPVTLAVVPTLVPAENLDAANGLMLFTQRFAEVAFVGIAGVLVAAVGAGPRLLD